MGFTWSGGFRISARSLAIAVANLDEVIKLIRAARDPAIAKEQLMARPWPAADVITRQQDPSGREPLIQHFLKSHEGSNARVREALAALLADSAWDVKGYTPKVEAALPEAYKLDSKGRVLRK